MQTRRVAGRQTEQQRPKVGQAQVAHLHVQSLAHVQRPVAEHQSPAAVQEVDAGGRAVRREDHVGASGRVKVQVIVQRGGEAPHQPGSAESSGGGGGRRGGGGGGGGGAAGDELSVVIELEGGHLGSGRLVVLQLIVAVIGRVVATLGQIGTQAGCAQAAGSHALSKRALCGGECGQTITRLGKRITGTLQSQLGSFPFHSARFLFFFPPTNICGA